MKKVKRIIATIIATAMMVSLAACTAVDTKTTTVAATTKATVAAGETTAAPAGETTAAAGTTYKVGVAMPTQSSCLLYTSGAADE